MPRTPHLERHFTASATIRDIVLGMADGLTVPFALAAGLSGAFPHNDVIVTAGLAEIVAGSIAMGLGGYLAARSEFEHYQNELHREEREIIEKPEQEKLEVREVFRDYGLSETDITPIINSLQERPVDWVNFMMRFELGLETPDPGRANISAITIAGSYIAGGLIPLIPYLCFKDTLQALICSAIFTLLALFIFGYVKGKYTGTTPLRSALQTMLVGGCAASAAFGIAKLIPSNF